MKEDMQHRPVSSAWLVEDSLTEDRREGAPSDARDGDGGRGRGFSTGSPRSGFRMVGSASFGTDTDPSGDRDRDRRLEIRRPKVRDRAADAASGEKSGSRRTSCRSGPAAQEPRRPAAGSLLARHLHRRLPGGALRDPRRRGSQPVARRDLAPQAEWETEYERWHRCDLSARRTSTSGPTVSTPGADGA